MITTKCTTDLDKLGRGFDFTWGEVTNIQKFSEYTVVEYHPFVFDGAIGTNKIDTKLKYHIYIDGKDCSRSYEDFDSAIAGCLAYKYDGCNTRADIYFMKMIKEEKQ